MPFTSGEWAEEALAAHGPSRGPQGTWDEARDWHVQMEILALVRCISIVFALVARVDAGARLALPRCDATAMKGDAAVPPARDPSGHPYVLVGADEGSGNRATTTARAAAEVRVDRGVDLATQARRC